MMEHLGGHFGKVCFFSFVLKKEEDFLPLFDYINIWIITTLYKNPIFFD